MPHFRDNTKDADIWKSVFEQNEYSIREEISGATVVDIGGHIGSFASLVAFRGADKVVSVEASKSNFVYLKRNTKVFANVVAKHLAVGAKSGETLFLDDGAFNTGQYAVGKADGNNKIAVKSITFSDLIKEEKIGKIDILKLDCEGSEWIVLPALEAAEWKMIGEVVGEFHIGKMSADALQGREFKMKNMAPFALDRPDIPARLYLKELFEANGFEFFSTPHPTQKKLGWFYAINKTVKKPMVDNCLTMFHLEDDYKLAVERKQVLYNQKVHRDAVIAELTAKLKSV